MKYLTFLTSNRQLMANSLYPERKVSMCIFNGQRDWNKRVYKNNKNLENILHNIPSFRVTIILWYSYTAFKI